MDGMDELRSPSLPTSPAAPIIVFPLPSMLSVLQFLGTIRCPEKPRAAHRDFYYLIGLRFERAGNRFEHSFWADKPDNERDIWGECLRMLKAIESPQIVHYGSYESRFLRKMKERYQQANDDCEFIDHIIETSINLVSCVFGKVYF